MDLFHNLSLGFSVVLSFDNLLYCFVGALIGTLIGVLPGIGPTATMAMLLPITFTMSPTSALIMLAGIFYGAQYGGSTTAILINLPGEPSSAVTTIDGYQMARNGRAGPALAAAAISSFFAGTVSTLLIALFAVPLTSMALEFGPAEYFALMVLGLTACVALAGGSALRALCMIVFGLLVGLVGTDVYTGAPRFTLGIVDLYDGVDFVAVAVGVFGIGEILRNLEDEGTRSAITKKVKGLMPTRDDLRRISGPTVRGTLLGAVLGVLPGGGILASFAAYTLEKKISPNGHEFGKGAIEGVAAPEAANNAGAQTAFVPMLTLGIPSNAVMALMIGAMVMQGIVPGPNVATGNPQLFWGLIVSMWVGNLMLVLLNLPLVGLWVRLLSVPYSVMFPAILAFCAVGVYSLNSNPFDLYQVTVFGLIGYLLMKLGCEPAPFILAFIIGRMMEENFRRAMLISHGDPLIFLQRPVSAGLLLLAVVAIAVICLPNIARKREKVFVED